MALAQTHKLLIEYRYDPLDRLATTHSSERPQLRFYKNAELINEIHPKTHISFFRESGTLLAQKIVENGISATALLTTNQTGSVLNASCKDQLDSYDYCPYGHRLTDNNSISAVGFNGERPEPVTHHYLLGNGYRAFNPVLKRFNSPDSMSPFGKGGINAYAYSANPMTHVDPTGHFSMVILNLVSKPDVNALWRLVKFDTTALEKTLAVTKKIPENPLQGLAARSLPDSVPLQAVPGRHQNNKLFNTTIDEGAKTNSNERLLAWMDSFKAQRQQLRPANPFADTPAQGNKAIQELYVKAHQGLTTLLDKGTYKNISTQHLSPESLREIRKDATFIEEHLYGTPVGQHRYAQPYK